VLANANPSVEALQQLSRTLPIVFVAVTEPVGSRLVESMARPGGNATGVASAEFGPSAFAEPPEHGSLEMSRLVLGRNVLVTQLSPHGHDLGEPFDRSVPLHNSCRHDRDILCDQPRIEAVVLGQHAAGAGELTKLVRVDTSHR